MTNAPFALDRRGVHRARRRDWPPCLTSATVPILSCGRPPTPSLYLPNPVP